MQRLPFLTESKAAIIADASVIINLNATGRADAILKALPNPLVMVNITADEVNQGSGYGHTGSLILPSLVSAGHLRIQSLGELGEEIFNQLVAGSACDTLDDGEAATIAYALEHQAMAAIDEKKANRICAGRYPSLAIVSTLDIFSHPSIEAAIGRELLADSVFMALKNARMRVPLHHVEGVVSLIGSERATLCTSLSANVRGQQAELAAEMRKNG